MSNGPELAVAAQETNVEMIVTLKYFTLLTLTLVFISCNGQKMTRNESFSENSEQLIIGEARVLKPEKGFCCGFLDSKGVLWFGTNGSGVYCSNGTSFTHFTESDGLSDNQVWAMTEDHDRNLWFGTAKGLCRFDGESFTTIAIPQSDTSGVWLDQVYPIVNPNQIMSLLQDSNDVFWIGTNGAGVYSYDGKTFTQHLSHVGALYDDSLHHNIVLSISEDVSGNIWFTSLSHGGVSCYNGEYFTHFMPEDGLSDDMVRTSFVDRDGNVWFGFNGNRNSGLTYFDGKSFETYSKEDGLCSTNIRAIYQDEKGNLWLGSDRGNLCLWNGESFTEFKTKEGRTINGVLFIVGDSKGNIWFGGKDGLWKFDGALTMDMTL